MKHILLTLFLASAACGAETLDITKDWQAMPVRAAANADVAKALPENGAWKDGAEDWVTLSGDFGGDAWKLVGCGDFNGDEPLVLAHVKDVIFL